jgi:hypothetical protein
LRIYFINYYFKPSHHWIIAHFCNLWVHWFLFSSRFSSSFESTLFTLVHTVFVNDWEKTNKFTISICFGSVIEMHLLMEFSNDRLEFLFKVVQHGCICLQHTVHVLQLRIHVNITIACSHCMWIKMWIIYCVVATLLYFSFDNL